MRKEDVSFEGSAGKTIKGRIYHPEKENPPAVLMVHGYGGEGLDDYWTKVAREICKEGFGVLTFRFSPYNTAPDVTDLSIRDEKEELKRALDYLERQDIDRDRMGVLAQSLGSKISVLRNDPRVKVYVLLALNLKLSPDYYFDDGMIDELRDQGKCKTEKGFMVGEKFWNELKDIRTITKKQIERVSKPVLLIWGSEDGRTPSKVKEKIYEKFKSPKNMYVIRGAPHVTIRDEYRKETLDKAIPWLRKHL